MKTLKKCKKCPRRSMCSKGKSARGCLVPKIHITERQIDSARLYYRERIASIYEISRNPYNQESFAEQFGVQRRHDDFWGVGIVFSAHVELCGKISGQIDSFYSKPIIKKIFDEVARELSMQRADFEEQLIIGAIQKYENSCEFDVSRYDILVYSGEPDKTAIRDKKLNHTIFTYTVIWTGYMWVIFQLTSVDVVQ
ncbi:hypothetical protein [Sulfuricurvum sp.]|uniref:hypothetical protein n=1 Tax=Sulfuricurvum sp. TaxID=2025608 RepID=UPI00356B41AB